jgi:hypothetical protein
MSGKCFFYIETINENFNLNCFKFYLIDIWESRKLALSSQEKLLVTDSATSLSTISECQIQIIMEYNFENSTSPTSLRWVRNDAVCVGFDNGTLICFTEDGSILFEYDGFGLSIQSMRVFESSFHRNQIGLGVIYENGSLTIVSSYLLHLKHCLLFRFRFRYPVYSEAAQMKS